MGSRVAAIVLTACVLLAAAAVALRGGPIESGAGAMREVVLVAREMTFYLAGEETDPNPTLRFRPGERVRLVLRNEEAGVKHNFSVPAWKIETRELNGRGAAEIDFVVPPARGSQRYECAPHALMMRGTIEVR
ncbi:MAG TPA: hypothetical protein VK886_02745 [Vicinamibacterales bacterium]|nr:hypothetical protein [Vicinamibacterales bacterium]